MRPPEPSKPAPVEHVAVDVATDNAVQVEAWLDAQVTAGHLTPAQARTVLPTYRTLPDPAAGGWME